MKSAIEPVFHMVIWEIENEHFSVFPSYIGRVNLWNLIVLKMIMKIKISERNKFHKDEG